MQIPGGSRYPYWYRGISTSLIIDSMCDSQAHSFPRCLCFSDIDECASKPCDPNGQCIDGVNSYTCECNAGYTGKHCEKSKRECRTCFLSRDIHSPIINLLRGKKRGKTRCDKCVGIVQQTWYQQTDIRIR